MSMQASETFYRLVETLDAVLELFDGNWEVAQRWLPSPMLLWTTNARSTCRTPRLAGEQYIVFEYGLQHWPRHFVAMVNR